MLARYVWHRQLRDGSSRLVCLHFWPCHMEQCEMLYFVRDRSMHAWRQGLPVRYMLYSCVTMPNWVRGRSKLHFCQTEVDTSCSWLAVASVREQRMLLVLEHRLSMRSSMNSVPLCCEDEKSISYMHSENSVDLSVLSFLAFQSCCCHISENCIATFASVVWHAFHFFVYIWNSSAAFFFCQ